MIDATCVQTTYKYLVFEVAVTLSKFCWNVPGSLNLKVGMQWFLQSCNLTRQDIAPNFLSSQGFMLLSRLQIQPKFTSQHFGIQATKPEMRLLNMHKLHFISLHLFFWFLQPFMFFFCDAQTRQENKLPPCARPRSDGLPPPGVPMGRWWIGRIFPQQFNKKHRICLGDCFFFFNDGDDDDDDDDDD